MLVGAVALTLAVGSIAWDNHLGYGNGYGVVLSMLVFAGLSLGLYQFFRIARLATCAGISATAIAMVQVNDFFSEGLAGTTALFFFIWVGMFTTLALPVVAYQEHDEYRQRRRIRMLIGF